MSNENESNIKKAFKPLVDYLEAHQNHKVSSVMDKVMEFATKSTRAAGGAGAMSTLIKNTAGEVVAIHDYYFKRWMPLVGEAAVEFGKKASSSSGYSSMCKEGVAQWTKQQREAKEAVANLLVQVEQGEVAPEDISDAKEKIEADRKRVESTELGFANKDACIAYLTEECGIELDAASTEEAEA